MPDSTRTPARKLPSSGHPNLQEEIRRLAFQLYMDRGYEDGHDLDDWLLAETEVLGTTVDIAA